MMPTMNDHPDLLLRRMARLVTHEPDPKHAERLRARCHRAMTRKRRDVSRPGFASGDRWPRLIETAVISAMAALYLVEVFRRALQLYGF